MNKRLLIYLLTDLAIILFGIGMASHLLAAEVTPIPTPIPVAIATPAPAPVDAEAWLSWLQSQPTAEEFWLSYYEFPDGDERPAERCVQVPGAGCGVVSTRGYSQAPGGWWNQGFVENEVTAWWKDISFVTSAYAASGKVKSSHKFQHKVEKRPDKPKKLQWKKSMEIVW